MFELLRDYTLEYCILTGKNIMSVVLIQDKSFYPISKTIIQISYSISSSNFKAQSSIILNSYFNGKVSVERKKDNFS